jgi:hypothetical protein
VKRKALIVALMFLVIPGPLWIAVALVVWLRGCA